MTTRTKVILIATPMVLLLLAAAALFAFIVAGGSDEGSPALAAEWRDEFAAYQTPAAATAADPTIEYIAFDNGDWLIGRARDSHGMWRGGGGTVVVKGSNGETHAFFGHVCGDGFLSWGFGETADLQSFYKRVTENGFQEYNLE